MATFHLFPSLPEEIRSIIWSHSLTPRTISLRCQPPTGTRRAVQLELTPPPSPPILQTSRESRRVAKLRGYRPWTIENGARKRIMMWNPAIDYIYMHGADSWRLSLQHLCGYENLHALLWRRVALRSSYFRDMHVRRAQITSWVGVQELVIVYDKEYERGCRVAAQKVFREQKKSTCPWSIPHDVEYTMKAVKRERDGETGEGQWVLPDVRAVDDEDGIVSGQRSMFHLRCCSAF